jgi:hypothetical protein
MKKNQFEIRSRDVQEVMKKPPGFFLSWGNYIIIVIIAACIVLIGRIELPEQIAAAFEMPGDKRLATRENTVLVIDSSYMNRLRLQQPIRVNLYSYKDHKEETFKTEIVSLKVKGRDCYLEVKPFLDSSSPYQMNASMPVAGTVIIKIGKKRFIENIRKNLTF